MGLRSCLVDEPIKVVKGVFLKRAWKPCVHTSPVHLFWFLSCRLCNKLVDASRGFSCVF